MLLFPPLLIELIFYILDRKYAKAFCFLQHGAKHHRRYLGLVPPLPSIVYILEPDISSAISHLNSKPSSRTCIP